MDPKLGPVSQDELRIAKLLVERKNKIRDAKFRIQLEEQIVNVLESGKKSTVINNLSPNFLDIAEEYKIKYDGSLNVSYMKRENFKFNENITGDAIEISFDLLP